MQFDTAMTDELLATTRAVRKRLDIERPVPRAMIEECLELAIQAPTGGNSQTWRWMIVDDAGKRAEIAAFYRRAGEAYLAASKAAAVEAGDRGNEKVYDSAMWLAENLAQVPVFVIPCLAQRPPEGIALTHLAGLFGSIYPAVWSFQLALRSRGLGSTLTTLHLAFEREIAALLGIPDEVMQVALLPVAYTRGTDFRRAKREPVSGITHWNQW